MPTDRISTNSTSLQVWKNLLAGKQTTILLYGTSLTATEFPDQCGAWVIGLRKWATSHFGDRLTIKNSAEGGKDSQWGIDHLEDRVVAYRPNYLWIEFGMNDSCTPYGSTLADVEKRLATLLQRIRKELPTTGVGLLSMNPKIENALKPVAPGQHNLLSEIYSLCRAAAEQFDTDFLDIHGRWIERELADHGFLQRHIRDGVHPDGDSALEIIFPAIRGFLETRIHRDLQP